MGARVLSRGVKRPGSGSDQSPPTEVNSEVKNEWSCTSTPLIRLHGVDRNTFTFTYTWLKWLWIVCKVLKRGKDEAPASIPHDPPTLNSKLQVSTVPQSGNFLQSSA
jgi:hypothetical protein